MKYTYTLELDFNFDHIIKNHSLTTLSPISEFRNAVNSHLNCLDDDMYHLINNREQIAEDLFRYVCLEQIKSYDKSRSKKQFNPAFEGSPSPWKSAFTAKDGYVVCDPQKGIDICKMISLKSLKVEVVDKWGTIKVELSWPWDAIIVFPVSSKGVAPFALSKLKEVEN